MAISFTTDDSVASRRRSAAVNPGLKAGPQALPGALRLSTRRRKGIALLRITFGVVWAVDAMLKWSPSFGQHTLVGTLSMAAAGDPMPVREWASGLTRVVAADPEPFAVALAVAETLLALALIVGMFTNATCALGAMLAFGIWGAGEGFGGPYGAHTTDIGASVIYVLVFALLGTTDAGGVWGVDAWLRSRLGVMARRHRTCEDRAVTDHRLHAHEAPPRLARPRRER